MGVDHYENFPVASWLCPAELRPAVQAIYHFARTADDIADEGDAPGPERRAALARMAVALDDAAQGRVDASPQAWPAVFGPLASTIRDHALPLQPLRDLLSAFEQDTHNGRYADRDQLLDYCRRSANPVGRLMLHLAGVHDPLAQRRSDAVCTALQLINFWQDLSVDLPRGRHYAPLADLAAHGLTPDGLQAGQDSPASQALVHALCDWTEALMHAGAPVALQVPGRLGWELRLVVQGGLQILAKIRAMDARSLSHRPQLSGADAPALLWRAWRMRRPAPGAADAGVSAALGGPDPTACATQAPDRWTHAKGTDA